MSDPKSDVDCVLSGAFFFPTFSARVCAWQNGHEQGISLKNKIDLIFIGELRSKSEPM